jgi:hypothetical protein
MVPHNRSELSVLSVSSNDRMLARFEEGRKLSTEDFRL